MEVFPFFTVSKESLGDLNLPLLFYFPSALESHARGSECAISLWPHLWVTQFVCSISGIPVALPLPPPPPCSSVLSVLRFEHIICGIAATLFTVQICAMGFVTSELTSRPLFTRGFPPNPSGSSERLPKADVDLTSAWALQRVSMRIFLFTTPVKHP